MALLKFLRGTQSGLTNQSVIDGALYFTTDTHRILMGTASGLQEYSAIEVVTSIAALPAVASAIPGKFYYAESENVFCFVHNGAWQQVNPDTGATSVEVVGEGNAVTAASYDAVTRKLTLTKGETFATKAELDTLDTFVGDIPEGYTETNVIAYINKKAEETLNAASGGSSESAASVLAALNTYKTENDPKVQANAEAIEALQKANAEGGAVATAIADAQAAADQAQKEVDELETVVADYKTANDARVKALEDVDNATQAEMDAAVKILEDADAAILAKIGDVAEDETVVGLIEAAQAKADAAYVKPVDGIGSDDLHADVVASLAKADSALQAADIEDKADKATTLAGYGITDAYTKDEVDAAVGAKVAQSDYDTKIKALEDEDARIAGLVSDEADAREKADTALDERLVKVEAFFEGAAEDGEGLQNALDTLVEIQDYIDTHGEAASTMVDNIAANAKAIEDEAKRADEAEKALGGRIDDLSDVVDTKSAQADLNALDGRVEVVEGKVSTLESEMDAVEGRADTLEDKVADLEAASATHALDADLDAAVERIAANETAIGELEAASATHATAEDLNAHIDDGDVHVTTEDKAKWNGAQAAAEATAAANLATARTEITAEIAKAKGEAISDAEGKIATAKAEAIADAEGKIATAKGEAIADAEGKVSAAKEDLQGKIDTHANNADIHVTVADKEKWNAAQENAEKTANDALIAALSWSEF